MASRAEHIKEAERLVRWSAKGDHGAVQQQVIVLAALVHATIAVALRPTSVDD